MLWRAVHVHRPNAQYFYVESIKDLNIMGQSQTASGLHVEMLEIIKVF